MKFIIEIADLPETLAGHVEMELYGSLREACMRVLHGALHDTLVNTASKYAQLAREGALVSVHTVEDRELVTP